MTDQRQRRTLRQAEVSPGDVSSWLRVARDLERLGQRRRSQSAALRAAELDREDAGVQRALAELGVHALWPCARGDAANQQCAPLRGPRQVVIRWRRTLPRRARGHLRVDLRGRVIARAEVTGLFRLDARGERLEDLGDWPGDVPPTLVAGEPCGLDPARLLPRGPADLTPSAPPPCPFRQRAGWRYVLRPGALLALGPDALPVWRRELWFPVDMALDDGPLLIALLPEHPGDPSVVALGPETGEELWRWADPDSAGAPAVSVADDGAFLVRTRAALSCLEADGRLRWRRPGGWVDPATRGDGLVSCRGRELTWLDLASGEARWLVPGLSTDLPPLLDAEGWTYVLTRDGRLASLSPEGRTQFELRLGGAGQGTPPVLGWDKTLFVAQGPRLFALGEPS